MSPILYLTASRMEVMGHYSVPPPLPSPTDDHRPPTPTIVVEVMCGKRCREAFGTCIHVTGSQVGQEEGGAGRECKAYLPMGPVREVKCWKPLHLPEFTLLGHNSESGKKKVGQGRNAKSVLQKAVSVGHCEPGSMAELADMYNFLSIKPAMIAYATVVVYVEVIERLIDEDDPL
ncbi:hypothetical protein EI94DRAFT_1698104 [Lactarius quietus]|nr:hypothetical protein EI94DRAFT_1698104 [Lactarius quietus]